MSPPYSLSSAYIRHSISPPPFSSHSDQYLRWFHSDFPHQFWMILSLSFLISAIPFLSSFYIFVFFFGLLYPVSFIHLCLCLCFFFLPFLTNPKPFILVSRSLTVWLSNWISLSFKLQLQFQSTKREQGNEGKLTLLHPSILRLKFSSIAIFYIRFAFHLLLYLLSPS